LASGKKARWSCSSSRWRSGSSRAASIAPRAAIRHLLDLAPPEAWLDDAGVERRVGLDEVRPGQRVRIRPGERVPLDGTVAEGRSEVNQAPITGESLPVEKGPGDEVFAGTINGHGALGIVVTRRRDDTTLARIIHLVEQAQAERAPVQLFIDRFARWYTPAVVVMAVLMALVPILAGGDPSTWIYRALVVLVVACPCALVISTPVSMVSALAGAARHGVLIKGGAALERLAAVTTVAFDKTGTLTRGEVAVSAVEPMDEVGVGALLQAAAAVEQYSEHPVARAIVADARARGFEVPVASDVRAMPGLGVEGQVGATRVRCAAPRFFDEGTLTGDVRARLARLVAAGLSPVIVTSDARVLGVIGVSDRERDSAATVVSDLRREGIARVAMLTGDHQPGATAVGGRVGVDEVRAELLPAGKVAAIHDLRTLGPVAMVGDGINDAPALAAADVGIVMGAMGSDAAIETADIALMTDDLSRIPWVLRLSHATLRNVRVNVAVALGLKAAFVVAAALGVATLWMAVLADTGASVIVLANALRLRRFR
jgi:Zn2+/Cd2+-exporting ATPase